MARASWTLRGDRPTVEIALSQPSQGRLAPRVLLADTGAGTRRSKFEVVLSTDDCREFGVWRLGTATLKGAYVGSYALYSVMVRIPALDVACHVAAVGVPANGLPPGLDGIAGFRFLRRFTYGNFGDADAFGLESTG